MKISPHTSFKPAMASELLAGAASVLAQTSPKMKMNTPVKITKRAKIERPLGSLGFPQGSLAASGNFSRPLIYFSLLNGSTTINTGAKPDEQ